MPRRRDNRAAVEWEERMRISTLLSVPSLWCFALSATPASAQTASFHPEYYPASYNEIVEASKAEGDLLIYSSIAANNWKAILDGFKERYPWIDVQTLDLGGELFTRYYAEKASNARTADMISVAAIDEWVEFMNKKEAFPYQSPEIDKLPDWSVPQPGLYTTSADPMIIVYNKHLIPEGEAPKSMADMAKLVASGAVSRLTTYDAAANSYSSAIFWSWLKDTPDGWDLLETLAPVTRTYRSGSPQIEAITTGKAAAGFFVASTQLFPLMDDPARQSLLGWSFIEDGTPVFVRGMAITKAAASPNSAKLMLDFILSHDGQVALGNGGLTPYRADVQKAEIPYYTYTSLVEAVGEDNAIIMSYE